ncbi:hypothetical protein HYC85_031727 [Camellia sinensis]|uniref:Uncharacterized protein n=1 Tax=Camellia sinensis TaxID=4442 RepID=A0A7J7FV77_CAMSI|nr:hypothetical protein HYC85_031727 [Camellia sinensis]
MRAFIAFNLAAWLSPASQKRIRVIPYITITGIFELQLICVNFLLEETFQSLTVPSRVSSDSVIDTIICAFFVLLGWRDINRRQSKFTIGYPFFNQGLNILKAARIWISILITLPLASGWRLPLQAAPSCKGYRSNSATARVAVTVARSMQRASGEGACAGAGLDAMAIIISVRVYKAARISLCVSWSDWTASTTTLWSQSSACVAPPLKEPCCPSVTILLNLSECSCDESIWRCNFLLSLNKYSCSGSVCRCAYLLNSNLSKCTYSDHHEFGFLSNHPNPINLGPQGNVYDAVLKYITQMLMDDEDLETRSSVFQDSLALQQAEKSLYDLLGEKYPPSPNPNPPPVCENAESPDDDFISSRCSCVLIIALLVSATSLIAAQLIHLMAAKPSHGSGKWQGEVTQILPKEEAEKNRQSRGKKSHYREDGDDLEAGRSNKQLASYAEDFDEQSEMYDELLLEWSGRKAGEEWAGNRIKWTKATSKERQQKGSGGFDDSPTQCSQAMASTDNRTANDLLKQIRQHSSPRGDGTERLAHYIANALEARLAGTGRAVDAPHLIKRLSAADTLKAYEAFLTASPFQKVSFFFGNKLILKLAEKATQIHIIDFGITHGFQWPNLIQHLSRRPGGPPRVRITGIDFPQAGFRPEERAEETGRLLAYYCEKFNVPFEYNSVAKKWDTIRVEDLKIKRDEVLAVNCLYWLRCVLDETIEGSPRDAVLNLIKRTNPDLFIHGIVNGTYSAPFFVTRFREVLFQAYSMFDMFDAVLPRDNQGRMLYEREVLGGGTMSVIACEGTERVVRPETYKQWQIRNTKAGLRQLPLDPEIMEDVRAKVRLGYHKDFVLDVDGNWMLQGWKGRISSAISCWKPAQEIKN